MTEPHTTAAVVKHSFQPQNFCFVVVPTECLGNEVILLLVRIMVHDGYDDPISTEYRNEIPTPNLFKNIATLFNAYVLEGTEVKT